ncbi:MAG: hypothetical protein ABJP02_05080 [Parasphingorhabdus sp.]|uniref:hypothetical protein n=1 Tax=Parasphingorhabdus sp. TaxID=2709688 RepID=UPI003297B483
MRGQEIVKEKGHYWLKDENGDLDVSFWDGNDWSFIGSLYILEPDDEMLSKYSVISFIEKPNP